MKTVPASAPVKQRASTVSLRQSRYELAVFFFASLMALWAVLRVTLLIVFRPEGGLLWEDVFQTLALGLYRDLVAGLFYTAPLLGWFWIASDRWFGRTWHRATLLGGLAVFWSVHVFLVAAEYFFFEEFHSRYNTVAVDYLLYPHEVFINIWDSYPVVPVVLGCVALGAGWTWLAARLYRGIWGDACAKWRRLAVLAVTLAAAVGLGQTIPLKGPRFSQERMVNEIADNGSISFLAAAVTRHLEYDAFYRVLPREEAYQRVRQLLKEPHTEYVNDGTDIRRRVAGDTNAPRLNVVLILEESMGSEFWGCLGRKEKTLTPEMDKLAVEEGLLFENIYASGNRTVRGMEGVLASFPPLPGDAIVKRDLSENVETMARILKRDGYSTMFLYGGRGVFDGMRSFTVRNGYDRFVEQKHFRHPTFSTIWGVCDEDLMAKSVEEFRKLSEMNQPFFGTILSVSNHKPFTYPKGRIPEDPEARKRSHAVKYSDYALGQFFRAAKQESWWSNTVFVVVADHGARVYGSQSIPIRSYEIPLVILGPAVVKKPARLSMLGCSLDVGPTILGLLGRPHESMFFGRDLLRTPEAPGRVLINHNRDIGLFSKDRLVVLGLRQNVEFYEGNPKQVNMTRMTQTGALETELEKDATALFQVADELYVNRRYRIDP